MIPNIVKNAAQKISTNGVVAPIFNLFQGRCTFFAIVFSIVGIVLAFRGKLDANYAMFITAIQGLLVLHSWKEDIAEQRESERGRDSK
jgi:hypothetical protein